MKMMKYMTSIATALFALVACSDADDILSAYHNDPNAVHINAEVGKASADGFTRSNPLGKDADEQMKFNQDDEISVKADGQEAVTYRFNGSEWIPQDSKFLKWESENMTFTAYYPAASYSGGTIDQPQKYDNVASLAAADYMSFNAPIDKPKDNNALTLTMERQMARVVVEVVGFNDQYASGTTVNSVTINGVKAYKHSVGNKDKYYALMVPCKTPSSETFLSLEVGEGNTETLKGIPALEAGKSYTYQLTVGKNKVVVNGITVKDWTTDKTINDVAKLDDRPYLTFTAAGAQTFKMTVEGGYTISGLEYSLNGGEWNKVVAGEGVDFGGTNSTLRLRGTNPNGTAESFSKYSTITFTDASEVTCKGDIRTLLDYRNYATAATNQARFCYLFKNCKALTTAPDLPATVLADYCYYGMFDMCENLVNAPALPAETLAGYCYTAMFQACTNLETPPTLPAKTLKDYCYSSMFWGCENLKTAPVLPADTLTPACYNTMFLGCINLKTAPELPATTLAVCCYQQMFQDCTNLETAPALPAENLAGSCYQGMFRRCRNLSSVTMMASSDQIEKANNCCGNWLDDAGTNVISHTLKVKDEDAYNALESKGYLPDDWKDPRCNVQIPTPYLTFTAEGAQTFKMTVEGGYTISGLEYSLNGGKWNEVVAGEGVNFGGTNSTLRLRGTNPKGTAESLSKYSKITFIVNNVKVACTGDIRTLLNHANYKNVATDQARFCKLFENCAALTSAPALPAKDLADKCYSFMFEGCTSLKTAPNLPATKLAKNCYFRMFNGCKSLETAPTLLAESLVSSCYGYMFMNCTNLKSAPELRATALALNCYQGMFQGCTSLETAPTLPATTLAIQCYNYMFMDCTNLTSVTMLAPSDQISTNRLSYWLEGAGTNAASRTLKVKDEAAYNALVNNSYLPAKWKKDQCTVKNESGTPIK